MSVPTRKVIPISTARFSSSDVEEVADRAFELWLARRFQKGSPEKDLRRAMRDTLRGKRIAKVERLFLVRAVRAN